MKKKYVNIDVNPLRCDGCAMCVAICPRDVLSVTSTEGRISVVAMEPGDCACCGFCMAICSRDAINVEVHRLRPTLG